MLDKFFEGNYHWIIIIALIIWLLSFLSPDYETLTEINHEIRLKIFETFEKEGLKFAYPTRTVHLTKEN